MGQTEIDCVVVDLDLRREKALNVALNKIQGDWDEEKLASLMAEFDAADFDVSLTGFEASEVDALLNRFYSHEAQEDEFDADAAQEKIAEEKAEKEAMQNDVNPDRVNDSDDVE